MIKRVFSVFHVKQWLFKHVFCVSIETLSFNGRYLLFHVKHQDLVKFSTSFNTFDTIRAAFADFLAMLAINYTIYRAK